TQIVYGLAFSADGTLACAGRSGRIHLYNGSGGQETMVFPSPQQSEAIAFSADSDHLVCSGRSYAGPVAEIWDVNRHELLGSSQTGPSVARSVALGPRGRLLVVADGNVVKLFDPHRPGHKPIELPGHTNIVNAVALHPAGTLIASASED